MGDIYFGLVDIFLFKNIRVIRTNLMNKAVIINKNQNHAPIL